MAIDVDIDIQNPRKKKLASMKKDVSSASSSPFRNKAEADAYKKNMESIVKPGYTEMGKKERSASEMADFVAKKANASKKAKIDVMKKAVSKRSIHSYRTSLNKSDKRKNIVKVSRSSLLFTQSNNVQ